MKKLVKVISLLVLLGAAGCRKEAPEVPHEYKVGDMVKQTDYKVTLNGNTLTNPLRITKVYGTHPHWYTLYDVIDANGITWLEVSDETLKPVK